jgi:hypothetical protein
MLSHGVTATTARSASLVVTLSLVRHLPLTCADGLSTTRPSLLWVISHSLGAATYTPEQMTTVLARCLHRHPLAFAHAEEARLLGTPQTCFTWEAFRRL